MNEIYKNFIISKLESWNCEYVKMEDDTVLKNVYDLYHNNKYTDCDDVLYLNYAGIYAKYHNNDNNLSEKYYLMAIDKGNVYSMHNLAIRYINQKQYKLAEKYFLMAVDGGNELSIYKLAKLYITQRKYDLAEKYYSMTIQKGNIYTTNKLAKLYIIQRKYDLAKEYILIGINKGNIRSIRLMALLYDKLYMYSNSDKYLTMTIKYLTMAIEKGDSKSMWKLAGKYGMLGNHELARHYYVMGAINHHKLSVSTMNFILTYNFNMNDLIELSSVIDDYNRNILNDVLKFVIINRHSL